MNGTQCIGKFQNTLHLIKVNKADLSVNMNESVLRLQGGVRNSVLLANCNLINLLFWSRWATRTLWSIAALGQRSHSRSWTGSRPTWRRSSLESRMRSPTARPSWRPSRRLQVPSRSCWMLLMRCLPTSRVHKGNTLLSKGNANLWNIARSSRTHSRSISRLLLGGSVRIVMWFFQEGQPTTVFTSATYLIHQTNMVMITVKDKCE